MEEALWFQSQQFSDEGSSLTSLREAESILQTLAGGNGDVEAFATLESDSDSEESVASRYKSSHDTPNDPEGDESDDSSTPEPTEEVTLGSGDRQLPSKKDRTPTPTAEETKDLTPTAEEVKDHTLKPPAEEAKDHTLKPPAEEAKDRTPTPPVEEAKDRTPSPPKERKEGDTQSDQPDEDDTMPYPYPKYRDC